MSDVSGWIKSYYFVANVKLMSHHEECNNREADIEVRFLLYFFPAKHNGDCLYSGGRKTVHLAGPEFYGKCSNDGNVKLQLLTGFPRWMIDPTYYHICGWKVCVLTTDCGRWKLRTSYKAVHRLYFRYSSTGDNDKITGHVQRYDFLDKRGRRKVRRRSVKKQFKEWTVARIDFQINTSWPSTSALS